MQRLLAFSLLVLLLSIGVLSPVQAGPGGGEATPAVAPASVLSPEVQLSRPSTASGEDWYHPVAAYNTLRHAQVMFTHAHAATGGDIYGYRWSVFSPDWVWFWTMLGVQPAVAYNRTEDQFLLVSMFDSDQDGYFEIWGNLLQGDGSFGGSAFLIFDWPNRSFWSPRVAWNSYRNEYLVVWNAVDTTSGLPNDVAAARVSAAGTVLSAPHIIADTDAPHQADVAYNVAADEYLVVWRRQWLVGDWDIYGARLRGSDAAVFSPPGRFAISAATEDERSPAVTTNQQGRYMVVWEYAYPGPCCDWDIRGQELDVAGGLVGGVIVVAQTTDDETSPRVVARPGPKRDYVAVWQRATDLGSQIWATHWGDDSVTFDFFQVTAAAWWDYTSPDVAIMGPRYLFVYEGDSQGDPTIFRHIYSRQWAPNAVFLPMVLRD